MLSNPMSNAERDAKSTMYEHISGFPTSFVQLVTQQMNKSIRRLKEWRGMGFEGAAYQGTMYVRLMFNGRARGGVGVTWDEVAGIAAKAMLMEPKMNIGKATTAAASYYARTLADQLHEYTQRDDVQQSMLCARCCAVRTTTNGVCASCRDKERRESLSTAQRVVAMGFDEEAVP